MNAKYEQILKDITQAQKLINSKRPFDAQQLPQLKKFYKAESTWSSNAIEGNTISLGETELILEKGITIHGHTLNEINECVGHGEAFDYMFSMINNDSITEENIKKLHYLFARNIKDIPSPCEYRNVSKTYVYITGSNYPCPDYDKVPELMAELVDWSNSVKNELHPVERAAEFHRKFVYIHPFPDGNGRVARLMMNMILLQEHYMPVLISPKIRSTYIRKLEDGRSFPTDFVEFIAKQEVKQQARFIKLLGIAQEETKQKKRKENMTPGADKMQTTLTLYHGSNHIIEKPLFGYGKIYNDYGLGFYCTKNKDLAKEWAAQENQDGVVTEYTLSFSDTELSILNLNINCEYPVLNWLYVLTQNRTISNNSQLLNTSIQYLKENFSVDYMKYDILIGYRADDSYFQFARDFLAGTIPYSTLSRAMKLGKLGNQIVLKSEKAFEKIQFVSSEKVISKEWFPKRKNRENEARNSYQKSKTHPISEKDFFITDIIRGRITDADKRILRQRVSTSRTREFGLDV